jgi:hypothetical protein
MFRIVNVDIPHERKPEKAHRLLAVDQGNCQTPALFFYLSQDPEALCLQHLLPHDGLQGRKNQKDPKNIGESHTESSCRVHTCLPPEVQH